MIFDEIAGYTFQCINAANAERELVRAKLLNGLGIAIGDLSLLSKFKCPPLCLRCFEHFLTGQLKLLARQDKISCRVHQSSSSEDARAERQQLSPHGFPRRLKLRCPLRAPDQSDVVRSDQISERPDERNNEPGSGEYAHD